MNKVFIIVLAVCLVSVHAFVKRDAEAPKADDSFDSVKKKVEETFSSLSDGLKDLLDPEHIKKNFNEAVNSVNEALNNLQKPAPKK